MKLKGSDGKGRFLPHSKMYGGIFDWVPFFVAGRSKILQSGEDITYVSIFQTLD